MFLVHNGQVLEKEKALVPIWDPALFADFRIYETLRVEEGKVVFLKDHLDRIFNSARIVGMELGHSAKEIADWINQCIKVNKTDSGIYRVIIHGDAEENKESQVYIYPENFRQPTREEREKGIKVMTFEGERIYPSAKTISRLTQFRATRAFKEKGVYEAILVSKDGTVHEGVRTNIFLVKDGKLITPSLATVLPGIRRRYVIELAKKEGIAVEERQVRKEELYQADEAFVTSTIMELAKIGWIDDYRLPPHCPFFEKLREAFQKLKRKALAKNENL